MFFLCLWKCLWRLRLCSDVTEGRQSFHASGIDMPHELGKNYELHTFEMIHDCRNKTTPTAYVVRVVLTNQIRDAVGNRCAQMNCCYISTKRLGWDVHELIIDHVQWFLQFLRRLSPSLRLCIAHVHFSRFWFCTQDMLHPRFFLLALRQILYGQTTQYVVPLMINILLPLIHVPRTASIF